MTYKIKKMINNGTEYKIGSIDSSNDTYENIIHLSQAEYDALETKDPDTLYSTPDNAESGTFCPENEGETGQILKKTSTGYSWEDLAEGGEEGQVLMRTEDGYAWCDGTLGPKYGYVDLLVVGGGGAGGYVPCGYTNLPNSSGGGGGGVLQCLCYPITSSNDYITVCVGEGGFAGTCSGTGCCGTTKSGGNSSFGQLIAYGGGKGGAANTVPDNGGSGGGASGNCSAGKGTCGQGHDGANHGYMSGGGGAGAAGNSTYGGIGVQSDLTGTMLYYGGGGSRRLSDQPNGSATCGCYGGGGAGQCNAAGTRNILGCQGIVVVRYKTDGSCGIKNTSSGGCKYTCGDYTIHCFPDIGTQYFVPVFK